MVRTRTTLGVGMNPVDERERVARTEHTLREIHEITTSPELDLPEQFRKVLALGRGLGIGAENH